jgi:trimeric autotransporter adhesin
MKRNIITTLTLFVLMGLVTQQVYGQSPDKMSYQAVIRNADDKLIENSNVSMRISILQGSVAGAPVYVEIQAKSTNKNGLVSIEIGSGTIISGTFNTINWANGPYFIKTETDPTGGTNYTITGTTQLLSVPYSLHAKTAETVTNVSIDLDEINDVNAATPSSGQVLGWNGSAWVPQNAGGGSSYTAGNGLDLAGTTFNAQTGTALWNANKLQGNDIAAIPATNGQVLTWNGTTWTPETPVIGGGSNWTLSNGNVYRNSGRVGINSTAPDYPLHINWSGQSGPNNETRGLNVNVTAQNTTAVGLNNGIFSTMTTTNQAGGRAISGFATGTNSGTGVYGLSNSTANSTGVLGVARSSSTDNSSKVGVIGAAEGNGTTTGTGQHMGVQGLSFGGTGVTNYGIYGESFASGTNNIGVVGFGSAAGGTGLNVGVYGSTSTTPAGATLYAGIFAGDVVVTGTFTNPSDRNLKSNILPIESALATLKLIQPVSYLHTPEMIAKMKLSSAPQFGFIAQDMELIFPHLVKREKMISAASMTSNQDGTSSAETEMIEFKSINYIGLIPILTKAIQEQQELINALEARLKALENK